MGEKSIMLHHDLKESTTGERLLKVLEVAVIDNKMFRFHVLPVVTYNASKPTSPFKIYREATLTLDDIIIQIKPTNEKEFNAASYYTRVEFYFNRKLVENEEKIFQKMLVDFNRLLTLPEKNMSTIQKQDDSKIDIETPVTEQSSTVAFSTHKKYRILALVQGEFGERKIKNIKERGPDFWIINTINLQKSLPTLIDDPQDFIPEKVPEVDLVLALHESPNAAQLIVDFVSLSKARALLAPIDNSEWMPEGQKNQIQRQLNVMGVASAFPRPFCVFEECDDPFLDEFVKYFGKPILKIRWEKDSITDVQVVRGAPCGCTYFVVDKLKGVRVDESVEIAGLAHHHYPCLASMTREPDLDDTLMHKSGYMTKEVVDREIKPYKEKHKTYLDPTGLE